MFKMPDSSPEPPSTPDRQSTRSHPSTTPAGPPPSNRGLSSFTPKGPPPSSAFGSSRFGLGNSRSTKPLFPSPLRNGGASVSFDPSRNQHFPASSPPQPIVIDDDEDEDDEEEEEEDDEDDEMADDSLASIANISPAFNPLGTSTRSSLFGRSTLGHQQLMFGNSLQHSTQPIHDAGDLDIHGFAKGLAAANPAAPLDDPDELIFETERIAEQLGRRRPRADSAVLGDVAEQWIELWKRLGPMRVEDVDGETIGPADENAKIARANFLASLALTLHYPPTVEPRTSRPSTNGPRRAVRQEVAETKHMPRALLDWLDAYHNSSGDSIKGVLEYENGYSASPAYWDAVFLSLTRAKFDITLILLRGANFAIAVDGPEGNTCNFSEHQLENIEMAMSQAIDTLEHCPAVQSGDWDIKSGDWTLFRHRVEQAKSSLRDFAEGDSRQDIDQLQSSRFARDSQGFSLSQASRRAESRVPFEVFEPLQDFYDQLLGSRADILKSSFDWVEAVFALTVWWDGEDGEVNKGSLAASRRTLARTQQTRQVDITPALAYRQQLATSLRVVMGEEDLRDTFDSTDMLQVGLACVLDGNTEGLIGILQALSVPIATAVAELASDGGWLSDESNTRETVENFDETDLMVLSYGQGSTPPGKKDEMLARYATLLSQKENLQLPSHNITIEGWQLALRVLGRLEDAESAQKKVADLLDQLNFSSNKQIDHVLELCSDLGFSQLAKGVTEKYADAVAESTHRYGDALLYYTRAHKFEKAKNVLDVLVFTCLVTSTAYPPFNDMDDRLKSFVTRPQATLSELTNIDFEAAEKISKWMSGYATLRKFYTLRDEDVGLTSGKAPKQALLRKKLAAEALLAVIASAGACIHGGLLDPSVEVVIPVDGLLVLLGEALPLLNQSPRVLAMSQTFALLKTIEDLQTIGPRIHATCEAVFQSALDHVHGDDVPSPRALLRKDASGLTGSSQFSLVGSSLLSSKDLGTATSESSIVLVKSSEVKRGWDWRKGLKKSVTGEDVLAVLRLALANEVANAWAEGEDRT